MCVWIYVCDGPFLRPLAGISSCFPDRGMSCLLATGADIPPELFDDILWFITHDNYGHSTAITSSEKHVLSICGTVCRHWARDSRPHLFRHLKLRSGDDLESLHTILATVWLAYGWEWDCPRKHSLCLMASRNRSMMICLYQNASSWITVAWINFVLNILFGTGEHTLIVCMFSLRSISSIPLL